MHVRRTWRAEFPTARGQGTWRGGRDSTIHGLCRGGHGKSCHKLCRHLCALYWVAYLTETKATSPEPGSPVDSFQGNLLGAGCHLPYFVIDTNTNLIEERNRRLTRTGLERFKNVKKIYKIQDVDHYQGNKQGGGEKHPNERRKHGHPAPVDRRVKRDSLVLECEFHHHSWPNMLFVRNCYFEKWMAISSTNKAFYLSLYLLSPSASALHLSFPKEFASSGTYVNGLSNPVRSLIRQVTSMTIPGIPEN